MHRAARAYIEFALDQPETYQLMDGLGGVRVAAADAWIEGQAIGDTLADHLTAVDDILTRVLTPESSPPRPPSA